MGKDIDVKGQNFELLPFGFGRRMCLGYNLGLKVVSSTLALQKKGPLAAFLKRGYIAKKRGYSL